MQILIIEDDLSVVEVLKMGFSVSGFAAQVAPDLRTARDLVAKTTYDAIVLDLHLPDGKGMDFYQWLGERGDAPPTLILTTETSPATAVKGLELVAEDYLRKPFDFEELTARVLRCIDRHEKRKTYFNYRGVKLDVKAKKFTVGGTEVALTQNEWCLTTILVQRMGSVVSRDELLDTLKDDGEISDRAIDVYISRIRSKLKKASPSVTETVSITGIYGFGYRLDVK